MKRLPVFVCFVLFIALCVSITYWVLPIFKPASRPVAAPVAPVQQELNLDSLAGLFGGRATGAVASNYQLKGVVDASNNKESVALLSADNKPAQAFGLGAEIAPGVSVKEVHSKYIMLSEGGIIKRLDLPEADTASGNKTDGVITNPLPSPAPIPSPPPVMNASPTNVVPAVVPTDVPGVPPNQPSPGQGRSMRIGR